MDIEIANSTTEKFIPHPILDDQEKIMRIIANPVYDKLTISRAAQMRRQTPIEPVRKSVRLVTPKEKPMTAQNKSISLERTIRTPSSNNPPLSHLKSSLKKPNTPSLPSIKRSSTSRTSSRTPRVSIPSRNNSIQTPSIDNGKRSPVDTNIRYVNSDFGFEIQRYSSSNWLSVDLLTKDACESQEKTFRDMLDKQEQDELSSNTVYTSDYYQKRWQDLLQSYKNGYLTHDQWAKQNYQLYCLKKFYNQALEREQYQKNMHVLNQRQKRSQNIFNQWKDSKTDGKQGERRSNLNTANSQRLTERTSLFSNDTMNPMSVASIIDNDFEELPILRPNNASKNSSNSSYNMLDEQRWSLNAMLKRIVGLAEPLPPPPKVKVGQSSALTNMSNDSGFESGH